MADLSVRDIEQLFSRCLILYKDTPCFVHKVQNDRNVIVENLINNTMNSVEFEFEKFKPVAQRLGWVNTAMGAGFLKRKPVRRFQIGISGDNSTVETAGVDFDRQIVREIWELRSAAITKTLQNDFPSLEEAYETAQHLETIFAFDRQFAVTFNGSIYYRGRRCVGKVDTKKRPLTVDSIVFDKEFEHLSSLLDGSYGKNC